MTPAVCSSDTNFDNDISNCGSCGRACSSAHVTTPACANKLCAPSCASGFADCNHPVAPSADDGCETNLFDVAHCGACGAPACNLPNATSDCPAGTCTIKSCSANHFDCDTKASNGCECGGTGCCAGGKCQTSHTDGFGHAFSDCETTYTETLARDAAKAAGFATPFGNTCGTLMTEKCHLRPVDDGVHVLDVCADSASDEQRYRTRSTNTANNTCYCPSVGRSALELIFATRPHTNQSRIDLLRRKTNHADMIEALPLPSADDVFAGQTIGKYEMLQRLAAGGMAEIFLARMRRRARLREARRHQAHPAAPRAAQRLHRDVPRRGAHRGHAQPPEHRADLRRRRVDGKSYFIAMEYLARRGRARRSCAAGAHATGRGCRSSTRCSIVIGVARRAALRAREARLATASRSTSCTATSRRRT